MSFPPSAVKKLDTMSSGYIWASIQNRTISPDLRFVECSAIAEELEYFWYYKPVDEKDKRRIQKEFDSLIRTLRRQKNGNRSSGRS